MSKKPNDADGWPLDGGPLYFEDLSRPIVHAIRCAYSLERKDRRRNIPWHGPEIGKDARANSPLARERLRAVRLAYAEDDQGRDALEEIVGLAIQLGIEQGRRIAQSSHCELLDRSNGAVFTVTVGFDHTSVHTQSGFMATPSACLQRAIEALQDEASRVERCPRHRAISAEIPTPPVASTQPDRQGEGS